jgi:hypothetical protein
MLFGAKADNDTGSVCEELDDKNDTYQKGQNDT